MREVRSSKSGLSDVSHAQCDRGLAPFLAHWLCPTAQLSVLIGLWEEELGKLNNLARFEKWGTLVSPFFLFLFILCFFFIPSAGWRLTIETPLSLNPSDLKFKKKKTMSSKCKRCTNLLFHVEIFFFFPACSYFPESR